MTFSLSRLIGALVVAGVVFLVCAYLLGPIVSTLGLPATGIIGGFLTHWAWTLGLLAGLWHYFRGAP